MAQQTRTQLAVGWGILFIAEIFILGLIPNSVITGGTYSSQSNIPYFTNLWFNISALSWWNTLIIAPFLIFAAIFAIGIIPTVNMGD